MKRTAPRTRKELMAHLWDSGIGCNVFREGANYAISGNGRIAAAGVRCIGDYSFSEWEAKAISVINYKDV